MATSAAQSTEQDVRVYQNPKQSGGKSKQASQAQPAARLEAESEVYADPTVVVEYGNSSYVFPASLDDADGDVLDAVDDQKVSYALRSLLGQSQWDKFKATQPKVRDYNNLFDAFAKKIGLESTGKS